MRILTFTRQSMKRFVFATTLAMMICGSAFSQSTSFPYQGRLSDGGSLATGNYDFQFALWDSLSGGTQIGSTVTFNTVAVSNGAFTVSLDFGADSFTGASRFLEIGARPAGAASFIPLSPRQQISSTPYAIRTLNATAADGLSSTCVNCVQDSQINAVAGTKIVGTVANANAANSATNATNATTANGLSNACVNCVQDSQINSVAGTKVVGTVANANAANSATNATSATTANGLSNSCVNCVQDSQINSVAASKIVGTVANANTANSATNATNATSATNAAQLGGVAAGQYVQTNDSRLTDTRPPAPGSANYIQNLTPGQGFNFNIGGNGTVGGTLSGGIVAATTQYNIGVSRFASIAGERNTFVGLNTGLSNTTGSSNAFFGWSAGQNNTTANYNAFFGDSTGYSNTTGNNNAFFGDGTGYSNTTGAINSFFGMEAGVQNTTGEGNAFFGGIAGYNNTTANYNAFFGYGAGLNNTTGGSNAFFGLNAGHSNKTESSNTFIGASTNGAAGITNATAIGASALVSQSNSLVLGSINGVNNATADTNVGIGTTAPQQRLHVDGNEVLSTGFQAGFKFRDRNSTSANDDWVWYSAGNVASLFRAGVGNVFSVDQTGVVRLPVLGAPGSVPLCRNASLQIGGCSSSLRYKTNVNSFLPGLSLISRLRPVSFNWKEGGAPDVGLLAEEVNRVEPRLTFRNEKGEIEGVKYSQLSVVLINAIKEEQEQIEALRKTNAAMSARLQKLEQRSHKRSGK